VATLKQGGKVFFSDLHIRIGRLGLACAVTCLLLASLPGCGGAVPTPEPVTIAFTHATFDTDYYEPLVQEFNKRTPHITVELYPREPGEWMRSGNLSVDDADVFVTMDSGLNWLQEQGVILGLDPFLEQDESFDLSDFYPGMVEHLTNEGKTWAIPAGLEFMVMFYNQDLFDQYNVPYPEIGWTWDDFLNIVLTMRDPEAGIFGYAPANESFDPLPFIYQHGGRIADDLQHSTRMTFDDPLTIEALEWYAKLIHEYDAVPTPQEARRAFGGGGYYIGRGFLGGKLGMWAGPLSQRGGQYYWPVEWDMRWGMVPLPRDVQSATIASVEGYFIASQTEHPDACWQWITFLSEQTPNRLTPARRSLVESSAYEQQVGSDVAAVVRASMESQLLIAPTTMPEGAEDAMETFGEAIDAIINGLSTPQEAMDWAQRQSEFK